MRTIARLYERYEDAAKAVAELEAAGIVEADISLVARHPEADETAPDDPDLTPAAVGAGTGEAIGAVLGGGAGLLAGLGVLAIPGIGLVVAAGWLVAAVTGAGAGAVAGSLLGALVGAGLSEEHARQHVEDIKSGGALVTVRTDKAKVGVAARILGTRGTIR